MALFIPEKTYIGKLAGGGTLEVFVNDSMWDLAPLFSDKDYNHLIQNPVPINAYGYLDMPVYFNRSGAYYLVKNSNGAIVTQGFAPYSSLGDKELTSEDGTIAIVEKTRSVDISVAKSINTLINTEVQTDTRVSGDESTVYLETEFKHLGDGTESSDKIPLPVASEVQAGVMNAATYNALRNVVSEVENILGASWLVMAKLGANATATAVNNAWVSQTGQEPRDGNTVVNLDNNNELWKYGNYEGVNQWVLTANSFDLTAFTNNMLGGIKGSLQKYQVFAEADGTGSVNGLDLLESAVSANTININNKLDKSDIGNFDRVWTDSEANSSTARPGNSLARRSPSGYLAASYFNQQSNNNENPTISQFFVQSPSDNYLRKASLAHVKSALGDGYNVFYNGYRSPNAGVAYTHVATWTPENNTDKLHITLTVGGQNSWNEMLHNRMGVFFLNIYNAQNNPGTVTYANGSLIYASSSATNLEYCRFFLQVRFINGQYRIYINTINSSYYISISLNIAGRGLTKINDSQGWGGDPGGTLLLTYGL